MLYLSICDGTTKEKSFMLKYKVKVQREIKGENVGLISFLIDPTVYYALNPRPDRGRPTLNGWWAPAAQRQNKKGVRGRGTQHKVRRTAYTLTHRNPKPIY